MAKQKDYELIITEVGSVVDHEAVAVEIGVGLLEDGEVCVLETYTGISKCDPSDKFDPNLGYELAYWRAIERAAKKNLKRLAGFVKHNDDVKAQKAEQAKTFRRGTRVGFLNAPQEFRGEIGYVVGPSKYGTKTWLVGHPTVNWCGNYETNWSESSLIII